jgi:monothiol glutaredoxin
MVVQIANKPSTSSQTKAALCMTQTMTITASLARMGTRALSYRPNLSATRRLHGKPLICPKSCTPLSASLYAGSHRSFSDGSHDDFAPKRKAVEGMDEAVKMIDDQIKENRVMLYMKGSPSMPQCGFSARVVQILKDEGVDFSSVNVLDYPVIREGVKKYSDWPTIPQLYVDAEFVGGCDIITSMHESGELKDVLQAKE